MKVSLWMNQAQRDRLGVLKKCGKGMLTQSEAGGELGVTVRHVKRLVKRLKAEGDACVIHGLRARAWAGHEDLFDPHD